MFAEAPELASVLPHWTLNAFFSKTTKPSKCHIPYEVARTCHFDEETRLIIRDRLLQHINPESSIRAGLGGPADSLKCLSANTFKLTPYMSLCL